VAPLAPVCQAGRVESRELRAGDADRERVAERLRAALDEGRLNLHEYDERLRDAYGARTYADLDRLLADLPGGGVVVPAPAGRSSRRWVATPDGDYPDATRRWLVETWDSWLATVAICVGIWGVTSLMSESLFHFWPGWVAGPWGAVLAVQTIGGLLRGEPQRWAAKQARTEAEREVRRQARGELPEASG
jgi:hypothetical protein